MARMPWTSPSMYAPECGDHTEQIYSQSGAEVFFGYHDRTPFSSDNAYLIAHVYRGQPTKIAPSRDELEIGVFQLDPSEGNSRFRVIDRTRLWSWQQASLATWNPGQSGTQLLYNAFGARGPETVLFDVVQNTQVQRWPHPYYAISPDGRYALGIAFDRLAQFRDGYGFPVLLQDGGRHSDSGMHDGMDLTELSTSSVTRLLDVGECAKVKNLSVTTALYFNHAGFSPDGRIASVFLISESSGKREIWMWFVDLISGKKTSLNHGRLISHYCWIEDHVVLLTNRDDHLVWRYSTYDVRSEMWEDLETGFARDGHPMFNRSSGRIVTDAVPDHRRDQQVFVSDNLLGSSCQLASYHAPHAFRGSLRCDLHPRFSPDGTLISVDRVHKGRRVVSVIDLAPFST